MELETQRRNARSAVARLAFGDFLRTGNSHEDTNVLTEHASGDIFVKYNHNHDARTGQFTSAGGGSGNGATPLGGRSPKRTGRSENIIYRAATASSAGHIKALSGGYVDARGHYVPEVFAPDPLALTDPLSALLHYTGGSGTPRNYYFNALDTSHIKPVSFPVIRAIP